MRNPLAAVMVAAAFGGCATSVAAPSSPGQSNRLVRDKFTADPAPLVHDGRLYLHMDQDEAGEEEMFRITRWLAYSTADMKTWTDHEPVLAPEDFSWASRDD